MSQETWVYSVGVCPRCEKEAYAVVVLSHPGMMVLTCRGCGQDFEALFEQLELYDVTMTCRRCGATTYLAKPRQDATFIVERSGPGNLIRKLVMHGCGLEAVREALRAGRFPRNAGGGDGATGS